MLNFLNQTHFIKQLSQFWYDKNTSETLAKEVFTLAFQNLA
jgi:hypothetical protein